MPSATTKPHPRAILHRRILIASVVAMLLLTLGSFVVYRSTQGFIEAAETEAKRWRLLERQEALLAQLAVAERAASTYLLTGNPLHRDRFEQIVVLCSTRLRELQEAASQRGEEEHFGRLSELVSAQLADMKAHLQRRHGVDARDLTPLFSDDVAQARSVEIRRMASVFRSQEQASAAHRSAIGEIIGSSTGPIIAIGGVLGVALLVAVSFLVLRDVAARRAAEDALAESNNLLSSVLDALPTHVVVRDLEGKSIIDNLSHRTFVGRNGDHSAGEGAAASRWEDVAAGLDRTLEQSVIETGQSLFYREEAALNAEGKCVWLSTTKVPLRDTNERIKGVVSVSTDISQRKESEERLRHFSAQLERSNAELQSFASVASHDLQEPLRKIQAFGDRLQAKCGELIGVQGHEYLARMQNAAARMQTLIQDLLMLSRVTSTAREFVPIELTEIVGNVLSDLEVAIEQSGAMVEVGFLPVIEADPLQMRQLFQNLLSNALKFRKPAQPPAVVVSARLREVSEAHLPNTSPGDQICQIVVQDNGIGFDEKHGERIFAVFQRLHTRTEYEGTGIGLSVCRKITDRHGGTIMAKSIVGEGTSFIITLPVRQKPPVSDE